MGHCPRGKTCNEVSSKLHYSIGLHKFPPLQCARAKIVDFHGEKCAGQNKNQFIVSCLAWGIIMGIENNVNMYFLVIGHIRNSSDGAFGHVQRRLQCADVSFLKDMKAVIDQSSTCIHFVCSVNLSWVDWKSVLSEFFKVLRCFRITTYELFRFESRMPGI